MASINWFGSLPTQPRSEIIKKRLQISPEERELMGKFGKEYFDAETPYGYGGYYYDGRFEPVVRRMVDHYGLNPSSRVLEIGCAKGYLLYELYKKGIGGIQGLDVSEYAIANTPPEIRDQCFVGTASDLSRWPDHFFDLVISKDVLHNLVPDEADQAIREIVRVGKGKGFIQVNSFRTRHQRDCLVTWGITIRTVRSTKEWLTAFRRLGYEGDHWFLIHDYDLKEAG